MGWSEYPEEIRDVQPDPDLETCAECGHPVGPGGWCPDCGDGLIPGDEEDHDYERDTRPETVPSDYDMETPIGQRLMDGEEE